MKFRFSLAVVLSAVLLSGSLYVHAKSGPRLNSNVTVGGITIAKADPNSEYGGSIVPGLQPGTTVHVLIELPGRHIIKINSSEDGAVAIRDSVGKTLSPSNSGIGFMSDIADDGQSVRLPISSEDLPSPNANAIQIEGLVQLSCGNHLTTEKYEAAIRKNAKMTIAGIEFKVTDIKDSYMNEDEEMFEMQCQTSPAQIQKMEGLMKDGSVVELRPSGRSRFGFNDSITYGCTWSVPGKAADISALKVTYFRSVENLDIPVNLNLGIGL